MKAKKVKKLKKICLIALGVLTLGAGIYGATKIETKKLIKLGNKMLKRLR